MLQRFWSEMTCSKQRHGWWAREVQDGRIGPDEKTAYRPMVSRYIHVYRGPTYGTGFVYLTPLAK